MLALLAYDLCSTIITYFHMLKAVVYELCYVAYDMREDYFIFPFQEPDMETGDIIIVLDETDHQKFNRKGTDLHYVMVCEQFCDEVVNYKLVLLPPLSDLKKNKNCCNGH